VDPKISGLNLLTLGELSILHCYTNDIKTSLYYLIGYVKNCTDFRQFSVSTFLESLTTNLSNLSIKERKNFDDFNIIIGKLCSACFEMVHKQLNFMTPETIEHSVFSILNLALRFDNEEAIVATLTRINSLKHGNSSLSPHSFGNSDIKFNANLIYPSSTAFYLPTHFPKHPLAW